MEKTHLYLTIHDIHGQGGTERVVINLCYLFYKKFDITIISYLSEKSTLLAPLPQNTKIIYLNHTFPKAFLSKLKFNLLINSKLSNEQNIVIANCNHFFPFIKKARTNYIRLEHYNFDFLFKKYRHKYPLYPRVSFFNIFVILSSFEKKLYAKLHKNIKVIPNFLPFISQQNTDFNQHRIISVGRMDSGDQKGFLRLIDIWEKVQERIKAGLESKKESNLESWQLIIVGSGVLQEQIESKIKEKNLQDTITLKPFTKDIEKEYLNASIYAMSSHFEGFPMVLLESCSYALCPIAFNVATGPSDIIESHTSGYLIEDNDLQDYADKLIDLMSDKDKRESMGLQAKQRVKERFSKEAIMPLWEKVFRDESV
ncbi:glycosyltransferase family 4 protein [Helicobacter magdeburgensis]|uniref:Glycosyltransferase family 4 protein n=1 Tax=Helicobacter magdeburgensis TaxID=471858 RepID=A0A4U8SWG2_9HELI|nr:glycosyltransferase family 4 protein [Helicobacter magdeburgensis]TLD91226.1 glycosyltransferase family 4 protein [Helicobacter magdeburgensis]